MDCLEIIATAGAGEEGDERGEVLRVDHALIAGSCVRSR